MNMAAKVSADQKVVIRLCGIQLSKVTDHCARSKNMEDEQSTARTSQNLAVTQDFSPAKIHSNVGFAAPYRSVLRCSELSRISQN
jgi:hypothetical protein